MSLLKYGDYNAIFVVVNRLNKVDRFISIIMYIKNLYEEIKIFL